LIGYFNSLGTEHYDFRRLWLEGNELILEQIGNRFAS
jgi:hypothetical protein